MAYPNNNLIKDVNLNYDNRKKDMGTNRRNTF